jgi:protein-S-isoprenylcysteine O-methyltransferase Ste14
VIDAPGYRLWPPVAIGLPLVGGLAATAGGLDPVTIPSAARIPGIVLVCAAAGWNLWALGLMARFRTGLLPGQAASTVLSRGPFGISRNPLYVGLLAAHTGIALMWPSFWALVLVPVAVALVTWGAIVPEERYLRAKFGVPYAEYTARVRRWF